VSVQELKYWGRWVSSMAPSGRSSFLKYLMKEDNEKHVMLQSYTSMRCEINANYELKFIPIYDSLDGKVS
jgi:hypothetical protein